jgi:hypothetical protein
VRIAALVLPFLVAQGAASALSVDAVAEPSDPSSAASAGRPRVELDRLDLSKAPLAKADEAFFRDVLAREARRADWGAGRGSHIEYRVRLDELSVALEHGVLRVRCAATGRLPKGKSARSRLVFGGSPNDRQAVVRHVLEIVGRGVVTRLADLERRRRQSAH